MYYRIFICSALIGIAKYLRWQCQFTVFTISEVAISCTYLPTFFFLPWTHCGFNLELPEHEGCWAPGHNHIGYLGSYLSEAPNFSLDSLVLLSYPFSLICRNSLCILDKNSSSYKNVSWHLFKFSKYPLILWLDLFLIFALLIVNSSFNVVQFLIFTFIVSAFESC